MTYRVAADLLAQMFPIDAGADPETLRRHTLRVGEALAGRAVIGPETAAPAITVTLDSTFIRSCEDGKRHLEVRVGNVETKSGGRQVFGAVANAGTDIKTLIRRSLDAIGRTGDTTLTAFTDGCAGLRRILADAGVAKPPILDWFHIGMRLQHLKQIASALGSGDPSHATAKAVIVTEVERLLWRIWNGKAKSARKSIDCIRAVMHHFRGEPSSRKSIAPSRKLWTVLHALDGYLISQSAWLVNYAERYRAGLRVGTAITEGTANFLLNRRMNKSQQMRWSRRGADLLLQVRCAIYNGYARFRLRTEIPSSQRHIPANGDRRLTPSSAAVPCLAARGGSRVHQNRAKSDWQGDSTYFSGLRIIQIFPKLHQQQARAERLCDEGCGTNPPRRHAKSLIVIRGQHDDWHVGITRKITDRGACL
jgi:hypothetical protein